MLTKTEMGLIVVITACAVIEAVNESDVPMEIGLMAECVCNKYGMPPVVFARIVDTIVANGEVARTGDMLHRVTSH